MQGLGDRRMRIAEYVRYVLEIGAGLPIECPKWPADVFAVCCSILDRSGALCNLGVKFLIEGEGQRTGRIEGFVNQAKLWRLSAGADKDAIDHARSLWNHVVDQGGELQIADLGSIDGEDSDLKKTVCEALVTLCSLADEVFAGVGISPADENHDEVDFWLRCQSQLISDPEVNFPSRLGSNLCSQIRKDLLRVLPKAQPPLFGLSTRSLTNYICLAPPVDIPVNWYQGFRMSGDNKCNMLLVPWPFEVTPSQIVSINEIDTGDRVGWFGYKPDSDLDEELIKVIEELVANSEREVGQVDIVILPETSVTPQQYKKVKEILARRGISLIAGVCEQCIKDAENVEARLGKNYAAMYFAPSENAQVDSEVAGYDIFQHKHHRWKIDERQIETYGIATQLNPQGIWWEGISLTERALNFFALRDWLCSCVLICEDLARIDPAGQFVRAVAPDLVIALLFDGPQIQTRWPAYHATVLADDPGSSVLTLSCLGMTRLSRPRNMKDSDIHESSRVVGMWRDPRKGHVQIKIPTDKAAALLTITRFESLGATADGRSNDQLMGGPVFSSLFYIGLKPR